MFSVQDNVITLTRGDTASFKLAITDPQGQPYSLKDTEKVVFTVKENTDTTKVLLQQEIVGGEINIKPNDTKGWKYGVYVYDVQLTSTVTAYTDTIIPPSPFILEREVNFNA